MEGYVNAFPKEPRLTITILDRQGMDVRVDAVIDTGFTEFLSLPSNTIRELGLERGQDMEVAAAGGRVMPVPTYSATITWHGAHRRVRIIALNDRPLIGMSLLWNSAIAVTAQENGAVSVTEIAAEG